MPGSATPRVAVVIPTYNGGVLTSACLRALFEVTSEPSLAQVIVVDDGSTQDAGLSFADEDPRVRLIRLERNRGFATACNEGAEAAGDCDFLLFLNNDTIPTGGWLGALVAEAAAHPQAAIVGARLLFPNGTVQHAGVAISQDGFPRNLYAGFPGEHPAPCRSRAVAAVTGACMLIRRDDFEAAGGFDAAFHNGYEDIDLCLRLGERGHTSRYCAESVVYHLESVTRRPDTPLDADPTVRLYVERWLDRVKPDDVQHFLDDGLLSLGYDRYYPITLDVAPELAAVRRRGEAFDTLERLLTIRSRQVMDLLAFKTRTLLGERTAADGFVIAAPVGAAATPPRVLETEPPHRTGSDTEASG